ncbi:chromosomal replication initiator protein DnaA [Adlercreutzia sp. ZJ141]|uniref:chromosomal replication initiator protein DnaA n=1 Tax=Adlercreutzia sp. ZJ141 TaxID=2709406 RepID=UPI0013EC2100|nr:chromosomal replication initiator protein DnaA [Adlercreutzia sp. ZJ141]
MNSEKLEHTWNVLCETVKEYEEIDPAQINAFFSRLQPQAMSDGFLMLTADNEFIKTWIERHYVGYIKRALSDEYGIPFTVVVEVDATQGLYSQQTQSNTGNVRSTSTTTTQSSATTTEEIANIFQSSELEQLTNKKEDQIIQRSQVFDQLSIQPNDFSVKRYSSGRMCDSVTGALTFENFVIGDSNRMAYHMAVSVAEVPGKKTLNPLFIYGRSGLGKTHLLRAIQNYINETQPHLQTIYVDSAELLSDYMDASAAHDKEKQSYRNFKNKYEEADVLLIDDVQWLQGKKQTLDIVFQIFNKLIDEGKQVVLSADRAPKNIDIDERYISRFNSGGTFDIQPPEFETKLGIVRSFISEYKENEHDDNFVIPEDIQMYIAESSSSNIRELKSAVTKVIYQISLVSSKNITLDDVKKLLENHFTGGPSRRVTIADIQKTVEGFYKVNHNDLVGKKRTREIKYARQVAIYLCRQILDLPYNDIGKKFSRDHSTVMYSVSIIEEKMKENRELREEIETLRQLIQEI